MQQAPSPDLIDRLAAGVRAYMLIAIIAVLGVAPGLFSMPPLDRDESRYAQATAQMLETGDFVRIAVQEDPRHKKPIGIHWLQAASVATASSVEAREIWAYRLPSLVGTVLTALAAFWAGIALVGRRAAFVGASLLAASLLVTSEGMIGKTDAVLCGLTTLTLAALARLRTRPAGTSGNGLALLAWAGFGAGILIKGPITPVVAISALAALALWERRIDWMAPLTRPWGPLMALAFTAPWFIAIGIVTERQFFIDAILDDLAPKISGGGEHPFAPPGLHSLLLLLLSFPFVVGLAPGARLAWRAVRTDSTNASQAGFRFLIAWAAPTFLLFEVAPTKLAHYPLPTYPALALIAAAGLLAMLREAWPRTRSVAVGAFALSAAGVVGVCAVLAALSTTEAVAAQNRAVITTSVGLVIVAGWALALARAKTAALIIGLCVGGGLVAAAVAREGFATRASAVLVSRAADDALREAGLHPREDRAAAGLWIVGYREPSLVFATETRARLAGGATAGAEAPIGAAMIVEDRERSAMEAGLKARGLQFAPKGAPVAGTNYSNGDAVRLQPGVVAPAGP